MDWLEEMQVPLPELPQRGGLIRELSSNSKPTFYLCTVFYQPLPFSERHSTVADQLPTALHTREPEG